MKLEKTRKMIQIQWRDDLFLNFLFIHKNSRKIIEYVENHVIFFFFFSNSFISLRTSNKMFGRNESPWWIHDYDYDVEV